MPVISGGQIMGGSGVSGLNGAGAPGVGTAAVQTLTLGGTPTGGTFKLAFGGFTTAAISWSATNATLVANIDAALEALPSIGTAGVVTAVGTMSAGIGTATITFADKAPKALITCPYNNLTGTNPTVVATTTTPGVAADGLGAPKGAQYTDTSTGILYINTGTDIAPTWTKVGVQT